MIILFLDDYSWSKKNNEKGAISKLRKRGHFQIALTETKAFLYLEFTNNSQSHYLYERGAFNYDRHK